jgi:hypothetical protein
MDPRRADPWRHPAARLYAEYIWGYISAIRRAPLPAAERRECYRHLAQWLTSRARPGLGQQGEEPPAAEAVISVATAVAGQGLS